MIVVDASVLANVVADDAEAGDTARRSVVDHDLAAPDLVDVEVASVLRRRWLAKTMTASRFSAALADLADLPVDRYPVLPLLRRGYELRANVTSYDATCVALAEALDCPLFTADTRLARASGPRCDIVLVTLISAGRAFAAGARSRRRGRR